MTKDEQLIRRDRAFKNAQSVKSAAKLASIAAAEYAKQQEQGVQLTEDTIKKFLTLSAAELNVLGMIASGNPPRNSMHILAAIRLKLEYTLKKPESAAASASQPVTVIINSLAGTPPPSVEVVDTPADDTKDLQ